MSKYPRELSKYRNLHQLVEGSSPAVPEREGSPSTVPEPNQIDRVSKYRDLNKLTGRTYPGSLSEYRDQRKYDQGKYGDQNETYRYRARSHQTFADAQEQARLALQRESTPTTAKRSSAETAWHVTLVVLWWLVLLAFVGEFGTQPDNSSLPIIFVGWIVFGIWRVVRKNQRRRTV